MKFTELNGENEGDVTYGFILISDSFTNAIDYYNSKEQCLRDLSLENLVDTLKRFLVPEEFGVFLEEVTYEQGMYLNGEWIPIERIGQI